MFAIGPFRFQCTQQRLLDAVVDCVSYFLEGFVYVIGPLLIGLALAIISLEMYTLFHIILPMMYVKYAGNPFRIGILLMHSLWAVFLVFNILVNYACCVRQKHAGPHYDHVVAELAEATEFPLPRTPDEVTVFRQELNDRLVIRMRRRNVRDAPAEPIRTGDDQAAAVTAPTKRRHNGRTDTSTANSTTNNGAGGDGIAASGTQKPRSWTLMGPFEWGYCASTNQPKPPRSHFDHVSKTLVLNLDHYCPWMFNASESMYSVLFSLT